MGAYSALYRAVSPARGLFTLAGVRLCLFHLNPPTEKPRLVIFTTAIHCGFDLGLCECNLMIVQMNELILINICM